MEKLNWPFIRWNKQGEDAQKPTDYPDSVSGTLSVGKGELLNKQRKSKIQRQSKSKDLRGFENLRFSNNTARDVNKDIQQSAQAMRLKNILIPKQVPPITQGNIADINKRNFIKKGILGLIAGIGIAAFSKIVRADGGFIKFFGGTEQSSANIDASKITSGQFGLPRLPRVASGQFLEGGGVGSDPIYNALAAGDIPNLSANKITSDQLNISRMPRAAADLVLTAQGAGVDPLYDTAPLSPMLYGYTYTIGNTPLISNDNTSYIRFQSGYIKKKSIVVTHLNPSPSDVRIKFTLRNPYTSSVTIYGKIYINGSAVGIERSRQAQGSQEFSEDLELNEGDTVSIFVKGSNATWIEYVENFRLCGTNTPITDVGDAEPKYIGGALQGVSVFNGLAENDHV